MQHGDGGLVAASPMPAAHCDSQDLEQDLLLAGRALLIGVPRRAGPGPVEGSLLAACRGETEIGVPASVAAARLRDCTQRQGPRLSRAPPSAPLASGRSGPAGPASVRSGAGKVAVASRQALAGERPRPIGFRPMKSPGGADVTGRVLSLDSFRPLPSPLPRCCRSARRAGTERKCLPFDPPPPGGWCWCCCVVRPPPPPSRARVITAAACPGGYLRRRDAPLAMPSRRRGAAGFLFSRGKGRRR